MKRDVWVRAGLTTSWLLMLGPLAYDVVVPPVDRGRPASRLAPGPGPYLPAPVARECFNAFRLEWPTQEEVDRVFAEWRGRCGWPVERPRWIWVAHPGAGAWIDTTAPDRERL